MEIEIPEGMLHQLLDPVTMPALARIRYAIPTPPSLTDPIGHLRTQLQDSRIRTLLGPGRRIAIGIGSRGIKGLAELTATLVAEVRATGAEPFIIPTMGSHGGATPSGQRDILEHLGVTEEVVGAEIVSQMETTRIGVTADGTPVYVDRLALMADGVVFIARIKPHTAFHGTYESGLAKMLAIGLGKQVGAATTHARGFGEMARMVPAMAEVVLQQARILFGVAVLENAHDEIFEIQTVTADRMLAEEPALLERARAAMPRLPFEQLDVLVIDEIGKHISGDGADPNITGRFPTPFASGKPDVNKQVILDLADASAGNGNGVGTADFTTIRLARKLSLAATYPNALTSTVAGAVKIPMVLPNDRLAIAAALLTCNAVGREPRMVRIQNTLQVGEFWVSEALLPEVRSDPDLTVLNEASQIAFNREGNLH